MGKDNKNGDGREIKSLVDNNVSEIEEKRKEKEGRDETDEENGTEKVKKEYYEEVGRKNLIRSLV